MTDGKEVFVSLYPTPRGRAELRQGRIGTYNFVVPGLSEPLF